jgi:hypothetical protein
MSQQSTLYLKWFLLRHFEEARNFFPLKNQELAAMLSTRSCHTTSLLNDRNCKGQLIKRDLRPQNLNKQKNMYRKTCSTMRFAVTRNRWAFILREIPVFK